MANKPNGTLYIEAPEKMDSGMEDSVDSRKNPSVDHCDTRWSPAFAEMTGSFAGMAGKPLREWWEPMTAW